MCAWVCVRWYFSKRLCLYRQFLDNWARSWNSGTGSVGKEGIYSSRYIHWVFRFCFFPQWACIAFLIFLFFKGKNLNILIILGFPGSSAGEESPRDAGDLGSIPGLGRPPGERAGYPLQCSGLESSMDSVVHGVARSRRGLSDCHFQQHL